MLLGEPARDRGVVARGVGERLGREALARGEREPAVGRRAAPPAPRRSSPGSTTTAREARSSSPPRGSSSGRRCRCSRSPRPRSTPAAGRRRARTGRGSRTRGRRTRSRAPRPAAMCAGSSRTREQAGVELRVQRLDAPVHDLREAREVVDRADLEPGVLERARRCRRWRRARRRARRARARSRRSRVLSDTESSARADPHLARLRSRLGRAMRLSHRRDTCTRRGLAGIDRGPRRAAISRTASRQQLVLDRAQRLAHVVGVGARPGSSTARWRMIGPVSTPSSTKWTVTPNDLDPVVERLLDRARCPGTRAAAPGGR